MKYLLHEVRFSRWVFNNTKGIKSLPADPLSDLRTTCNKISTFAVDTTDDLKEVIIGLFSKKNEPDKFEYFLIKPEQVDNSNYGLESSEGDTRYPKINKKHYDINIHTAHNLVKFAYECNEKVKKDKIEKKQVIKIIDEAVDKGIISKDKFRWMKNKTT